MAPSFNESDYLIIAPGSTFTSVQLGLGESFTPPTYQIPTKVYSTDKEGIFTSENQDESKVIYPIVKGEIVNIKAFNFFLKLIYRSILKENSNHGNNNIPLLLISSSKWSRINIELITQYVFETIELNAFAILPSALATLFAYGGQPNSLVIDIGKDKTEITPIIDYSIVKHAVTIIPFGGQTINEELIKILSNSLSIDQIESLKKSDIYEILSDEDKKKSFFGFDALNNESEKDIDVASIVANGKTEEFLGKSSKDSNEISKIIPNNQLENNSFFDEINNEKISIGKERFKGTEKLIGKISQSIKSSLSKIPDLLKRQECYDHIILNGKTTKIIGFQDALNTKLIEDYLIGKEFQQSTAQQAFQTSISPLIQFNQIPNSIKFDKMPEYFSEWKKFGFHDVTFLGAEIVSKQIFGNHGDGTYVNSQNYLEKGPLAIWDLSF
ncbi:hypothetical protein WICMUC_001229 [Wickerhamomyces mucosus]|uniref:Actin-like protein ARP9 n=1 Tax=Wickerhamomyces mucosus TaxID=1378264 RepID=A0A9P8PXG5_9ASCO|nr:hypothetical protein WICMUC_001229 [Wickerhamomyces mucosus]